MGTLPEGRDDLRVAGEEPGAELDNREKNVGDTNCRNDDAEGLAQQQLLATEWGSQQGFEGSLLTLADHGVGGYDGREQRGRNQQQQKRASDRLIHSTRPDRRVDSKDDDQGFHKEDEREDRHSSDDERA